VGKHRKHPGGRGAPSWVLRKVGRRHHHLKRNITKPGGPAPIMDAERLQLRREQPVVIKVEEEPVVKEEEPVCHNVIERVHRKPSMS
uniref:Uncharacterized protein n=1 Tax=Cyclopterus lumpus TaxID=8103 RepID=A0A8C2XAZ1_CYCLU